MKKVNIALTSKAAGDLKKISSIRKERGDLIKSQVAITEQIITKELERELKRNDK